jgi:hypothetical protein
LRLAAQENEAVRIVLASRLECGLGDGDCGAPGYDLLNSATPAVQLDAETKLLDPVFGHGQIVLRRSAIRTKREH